MKKSSKIYIAGHKGLLGSSLLGLLKHGGYENLLTASRDELDLTDQQAVERFFAEERPEYVFLAAGVTGGIMANKTYPARFLSVNLAIQNNVFEAAQKYNVKNLVFFGSSCMYPKDSPQPMKEEYLFGGPIEETSQAYATAKLAGVIACRAYNSQYKTNRFIALVPNSLFGPNDNFDPDNSHVLSSLIRKLHDAKQEGRSSVTLWGSGKPQREFVFVEDAAQASIFAVDHADRLANRHYNIGNGRDYSISELANNVAEVVGFKGKILWDESKPDGATRKLLDSSSFISLGWRPQTMLIEGLKITYRSMIEGSKR